MAKPQPRNVLNEPLEACCSDPITGWYRDGYCRTGAGDTGVHTICCQVTAEFLEFSREAGNDLSTPMPMYDFPGLVPGDRWCVCAARWKQAYDAGRACPVVLASCHISSLEFATLAELSKHAVK